MITADTDLERLDEYLSSDEVPDGCFMVSDLDGFLTGIACSPVEIPISEWLPIVLGGAADVPAWVTRSIEDRYRQIIVRLGVTPPAPDPIFWESPEGETIAMDWCEGFMDAVALRPKEWLRLTQNDQHGDLILPIVAHLVDDEGNSALGIPASELGEALDAAADAIPEAIISIWQFWRKVD